MKKKKDLEKRNLIIIIVLLCLLSAIILSSYYRSQMNSVRNSKEKSLKTVANFKIDQISSWYVDEMIDIDLISKDEVLSELIGAYVKTGSEEDKKHLIRYIHRIKSEHLYSDILLIKMDGELLVSTQNRLINPDPIDIKFLREAISENVSLNSDFFKSIDGKVYIDFIASIKYNQNNNLVGLICRKDPDVFLNPLIKNWPITKKTAETYLVKRPLNGKTYTYRPNLNDQKGMDCWRMKSEKDELSSLAADDRMGVFYGVNENNIETCSYISPIPHTPWKIVLRANKSELFKELYDNMIQVIFISILLILVCIGGISIIYRRRREKDLRDLLAKETDVRQYQERFNGTIDILGEGVCLVKAEDHTIVLTNLKMDEMFGYERGELTGKNISILLALTEKSQTQIIDESITSFDEKKMLDSEFFNVRKDGTTFWTTIRVNLISHDKFGPVWIGVVHDITVQKEYESELIAAKEKAEDNERLKSAFLANMSHEIRTPLNGIIGFSQLLNEENLSKEEIKNYSGFIVDGGTRLLALLSNILNISKIESGTESLFMSNFSVNDLMRSVFNQFLFESKEMNIDYKMDLPDASEDVRMKTDSIKLRQILANFLSNSFKFTEFGSIELGYTLNETEIDFFVKDSGIGIDSQNRERIFERFYQADDSFSSGHEGAGLGLAICKGFTKLMKGDIRIDSTLGKGSIFYLTLPLNLV